MSMRISDRIVPLLLGWALGRPAALLAAPLILGGCLTLAPEDAPEATASGGGGLSAFFSSHSRPVGEPLPQAPIGGGDIVVKGPSGYCVDGKTLRNRASGGFALLASCHVMTGGKSGAPMGVSVLTVSAVDADAEHPVPGAAEFAASFAPTRSLWSGERGGLALVHLASGGNAMIPEADPRHWRAVFELNGHLVVLAAYGPEDSATASPGGGRILIDLARALRSSSPNLPNRAAQATPAAPATDAATGAQDAEAEGTAREAGNSQTGKGLGKLFSGLFQ